jgi:predicted HNH restriction endonuclease
MTTTEQQREYDRRYRERHRKRYNAKRRRQNRTIWEKVKSILGDSCCVCGTKPIEGKRRIGFHEIHGKSHKENPYYILKHLSDFVPLCHQCHKSLHRVLRFIELQSLIKRAKTS